MFFKRNFIASKTIWLFIFDLPDSLSTNVIGTSLILNPFSATQTTVPVDVSQASPFKIEKTARKVQTHTPQVKRSSHLIYYRVLIKVFLQAMQVY